MIVWMLATVLAAEPGGFVLTPELAAETLRFDHVVPRPSAPPCVGALSFDAPPCRFASVLGTSAALFTLEALRPADARLVRPSSVTPRDPGQSILNSGAYTRPGLLLSGYRSNPLFIGLGEFDMRSDMPRYDRDGQ